jgi:5'-3' exonuclease
MTNLLIDGSSLIHRAYHIGRQRPLTTSYNRDVTDMLIFLRTIKSYITNLNADDVYVCWDKKIQYPCSNFRDKLTEKSYKGNRDKSLAEDVYSNSDDLIKILESLGIKNLYPYTLEADDVIAWLSKNLKGRNVIISMDKDLLQLISETTTFYHPQKKIMITLNNFEEEVGVSKDSFVLYKSILGDSSDNVKGFEGYGKVKAKKLAETIIKEKTEAQKLTQDQKEILAKNIMLMDLNVALKYAPKGEEESYMVQLQTSRDLQKDFKSFKKYCQMFEFEQILSKIDEWENLMKGSRITSILEEMFA